MATDVKNISGGDTGSAANGSTIVYAARVASLMKKTYDADGYFTYDIVNFDSGNYADLKDRFDESGEL